MKEKGVHLSMKGLLLGIALAVFSAGAYAHGDAVPPPPPQPPPDPPPRPRPPPDPSRPPGRTPLPTPQPGGPTTPGPGGGSSPSGTPPRIHPRGTPRSSGSSGSWRLWWEYNRTHLVGLRAILRRPGVVTGNRPPAPRDPVGKRRGEVLRALRDTAVHAHAGTLRSAAMIALGRVGDSEDARLFLMVLKKTEEDKDAREGAALGLGLLAHIEDKATRKEVREFLQSVLKRKGRLPDRARGFLIVTAGMRARDDELLVMTLLGRAASRATDGEDPPLLALACGLCGDRMVEPDLIRAVRRSEFAGHRLSDVDRAHAIYALARTNDPYGMETLGVVLASRRAGSQTRRAAALALGRLLREAPVTEEQRRRAATRLEHAFEKSTDSILRDFCAVAMGDAAEPIDVEGISNSIEHGGNQTIKPFAALALGFAARKIEGPEAHRIGSYLLSELEKAYDPDLASALCVSLGLARAHETRKYLLELLANHKKPDPERGAAAEGLGLMGIGSPEIRKALLQVVEKEHSSALVQDAIVALGLLGYRGVTLDLLKMLPHVHGGDLKGNVLLAMGLLDHSDAVEPLLAVLKDKREMSLVREYAAVALGLLGDRRQVDPLFSLDADFNFYATTPASNEIIRLY